MEIKYSFFGDFNITVRSIKEISEKFDDSYNRSISNVLSRANNQQMQRVVPVYIFSKGDSIINISPDRIDFTYNCQRKRSLDVGEFEKVRPYMPDYFNRLAINVKGGTKDGSNKIFNNISNKVSLVIDGFEQNEIFLRKNQIGRIDGVLINNVISVQNGLVKENRDFSLTRGIIYSFDINTSIDIGANRPFVRDSSIEVLNKMEAIVDKDEEAIKDFLENNEEN
ncbi:MAG: hypothetical protein K6E21_02060 [Bacilli bacterium]|nr:hypothetical protein [Bacilli bacterium]